MRRAQPREPPPQDDIADLNLVLLLTPPPHCVTFSVHLSRHTSIDSLLNAGGDVRTPAPNSQPLLAVFHVQLFSQDHGTSARTPTFSYRHSQDRNIPQTTAKSFTQRPSCSGLLTGSVSSSERRSSLDGRRPRGLEQPYMKHVSLEDRRVSSLLHHLTPTRLRHFCYRTTTNRPSSPGNSQLTNHAAAGGRGR